MGFSFPLLLGCSREGGPVGQQQLHVHTQLAASNNLQCCHCTMPQPLPFCQVHAACQPSSPSNPKPRTLQGSRAPPSLNWRCHCPALASAHKVAASQASALWLCHQHASPELHSRSSASASWARSRHVTLLVCTRRLLQLPVSTVHRRMLPSSCPAQGQDLEYLM